MKKILFALFCLLIISCSKEVKDGPYIYFSNASELPDTIQTKTDSIVTFEITAIGKGYKINRAQLFVNQTEFYDSAFSATDSITFLWDMNFTGRLKTQNILIQATDERDMVSTQTKRIYIQ